MPEAKSPWQYGQPEPECERCGVRTREHTKEQCTKWMYRHALRHALENTQDFEDLLGEFELRVRPIGMGTLR